MVSKKNFIALSSFALTAGLLVGVVPLYPEFSRLNTYAIKVDVVYAYFKTFSVSSGTPGLSSMPMVSYVILLNISNPTREIVRVKDLKIDFSQNASAIGNHTLMSNGIIRYARTFADHRMEYYWYPNSTRLVAFTATGEISTGGLNALKEGRGYFLITLAGRTEADAPASDSMLKMVTLETINDEEYVYNTVFEENYRFHFTNDELDISLEWWSRSAP